jgi:hypothetical protein
LLGDISEYIADGRYDFNPETQVLQLRIPQIYRDRKISGESNPTFWDDGIPLCGPVTIFRDRTNNPEVKIMLRTGQV